MTDDLDRRLDEIAEIPDVRDRLRAIADLRLSEAVRKMVALRQASIIEARNLAPRRMKWREIGEIFGVSYQRAEQMARQQPDEKDI